MMKTHRKPRLDAQVFLDSSGVGKRVTYRPQQVIFSQGDPSEQVMCVRSGAIRLSVISQAGKEAIVATLAPGDFFGEGALAGQRLRMATATAVIESTVLVVEKGRMIDLLHQQQAVSDRFIAYMLARNIRIEEDLVHLLFNSIEKRLARTLLLLARYGKAGKNHRALPKVSQAVLAEMVGTTRPRVNFFMNKFKKLRFIDYNGGLVVHDSLLTVVLHE